MNAPIVCNIDFRLVLLRACVREETLWIATMPARLPRIRTMLEAPHQTPEQTRATRRKIMKSQAGRRRYDTDRVYREAKQAPAAAKRAKVRESKQK